MKQYRINHRKFDGFTLVEVLMALVLTFIVVAAAYASYNVQQKNHRAQMQITAIQQNLRAALDMISRDFRVVGYDPNYTGEYFITTATPTRFSFTGDLCEEADPPYTANSLGTTCLASSPYVGRPLIETYDYQFDQNAGTISRIAGGTPIAEQIERLDFLYILENGVEMSTVTVQLDEVRAVKVSILARAAEPDFNYTDIKTYPFGTGQAWDPSTFNAASCGGSNCLNFRRRSLDVILELRNMGS